MTRLLYIALIAALSGAAALWVRGQEEAAQTPDASPQEAPMMTLELPDHARPVTLEVSVGPLPAGAELILETPDGAFVGAVSLFGLNAPAEGGQPQIAVPRGDLPAGRLDIVGRVVQNGTSRPATPDELRAVRLVGE